MPYGIDLCVDKFPVTGMACEIGAVIEAAARAGDDTWARIVDPIDANAGLLDEIGCVPTGGAGGLPTVSDVPAAFVEVLVWPKGRVISGSSFLLLNSIHNTNQQFWSSSFWKGKNF